MRFEKNNKNRIISLIMAIIMMATMIELSTPVSAASVSYSWPTTCHTITGNWGLEAGHKQRYHYGIDIGAGKGAAVKAAAAGTVYFAKIYQGYGYAVSIKHADGKVSLYAHMSSNLKVKKGQKVQKGQVVGYVSKTGSGGKLQKKWGYHLHFGLYKGTSGFSKENNGKAASTATYNPRNYLGKTTATTQYTVKYNANGGSGAPASQTKTKGKTLTLRATKPTRTGYTFLGWAKSSTATSATYTAGASYNTNASVTLYAVWKKNATKKYTVKYIAQGGRGSMSSSTFIYQQNSYVRKNTFIKDGYDFIGWHVYRKSDGKKLFRNGTTNKWYVDGKQPAGYTLYNFPDGGKLYAPTSVNGDTLEFYAQWKVHPSHTAMGFTSVKASGNWATGTNYFTNYRVNQANVGDTVYMSIQTDGWANVKRFDFYLQRPGESGYSLVYTSGDAASDKKWVSATTPIALTKSGEYRLKIKQTNHNGDTWMHPSNDGSYISLTCGAVAYQTSVISNVVDLINRINSNE